MEDNFPLPGAHSSHPMQQRCHQPLTMEMMPGFPTPCDFTSWWGRMKSHCPYFIPVLQHLAQGAEP